MLHRDRYAVLGSRATTSFGTYSAVNSGIGANAAPVVLWTSLCSYNSFQQSKSYVSRAIQFDRVPDIPVVPTVQSLNKVVDTVVYDSCPSFRQCRAFAFTDKVVDIPVLALRTVEVPQIQSSTELNDDLEAGLTYFSDSPERR